MSADGILSLEAIEQIAAVSRISTLCVFAPRHVLLHKPL